MSLRDIMRSLDELEVSHAHCESKPELRALLIEEMTTAALEALDTEDGDDGSAKGRRRKSAASAKLAKLGQTPAGRGPWLRKERVWPVTITLTSLLVLYRLHSLGLLRWMYKLAMGHEITDADLPLRSNRPPPSHIEGSTAARMVQAAAGGGADSVYEDDTEDYYDEYDDHDEF